MFKTKALAMVTKLLRIFPDHYEDNAGYAGVKFFNDTVVGFEDSQDD